MFRKIIRYNNLKIFIGAGEAKPGGMIGAMLSPYLFSANMADFCKKFNELTKDYTVGVWLPVSLFCDVGEKIYSFFVKSVSFPTLYLMFCSLYSYRRVDVLSVYDLVLYYKSIYDFCLFKIALIIYSLIRTFRRRLSVFNIQNVVLEKLEYV